VWGLKLRPYVAGRNILNARKFTRAGPVWITLLVFLPLPLIIATPIATEILIYGIFALGFNLLLGHTGILSFGHATYFGLGSYFTGIALRYFHAPVPVSLLAGILAAVLVAVGIGALTIRKRGVYFAMISLAFGQMFYFLALSPLKKWTGGEDGLKFIPILRLDYPFHVDLASPVPLYYFVYVIFALSVVSLWRILHSPFGRLLQAIREDEERTQACGYNTTVAKFVSLVFSGLFSGLAGGLFTIYLGYGALTTFHWLTSGTVLMMTLLGGMHTFIGPVVGAGVFLFLRETLSHLTARWEVYVGAMFVALVLLFPEGIVGTIRERVRSRQKGSREAFNSHAS
jgi:branched-chain amino acid transport system permease protein